jgi:hypothetical protein
MGAAVLSIIISLPAVAQDVSAQPYWWYSDDNGGSSDLYGYMRMVASQDGTVVDAYANDYIIHWGGLQSWWGAMVHGVLYRNYNVVNEDSQYYDGSGGWAEVDFYNQTSQQGDLWVFYADFGGMDIVDYLYYWYPVNASLQFWVE